MDGLAAAGGAEAGDVSDAVALKAPDRISALRYSMVEAEAPIATPSESPSKGLRVRTMEVSRAESSAGRLALPESVA